MTNSSHVNRRRRAGQLVRGAASAPDLCDVDVVHMRAVKAALAGMPRSDSVAGAAGLLSLLGNATRLNIVLALRSRRSDSNSELCVCDLAAVAGASKSMTSHQLRLLRSSGIVRQRRAGKMMYYRLAGGSIVGLIEEVARLALRLAEQDSVSGAPYLTVTQRQRQS